MSAEKSHKLKLVLDRVPPGFLVDSRWLRAHDVSPSSVHDYQRRGWLERLAQGVYRRPQAGGELTDADWRIPVLSAQWIMDYDFHVGATTALGLHGNAHYLPLGGTPSVYLYGNVPTWLSRLPLDAKLLLRRRQLFGGNSLDVENRDFNPFAEGAPTPWGWPLKLSTPERAMLEALNELPDQESFHALDMLFESAANLRPRRLAELLTACRSVKVKRLFFLFADRHRHAWRERLDPASFDLGSGPRQLVGDGKFNPIYKLMVPPEFARPREVSHGA